MRVLVRGGTGFVGRHVVWRSLLSGYDTVFTGRNLEAAGQVIEMADRVSPFSGDLSGTTHAAAAPAPNNAAECGSDQSSPISGSSALATKAGQPEASTPGPTS